MQKFFISFAIFFFAFCQHVSAQEAYVAKHPLDALTAAEIALAVDILTADKKADDNTRYPAVTLLEPVKAEVLSWKPGQDFSRRAFVISRRSGETYEAEIDLKAKTILRYDLKPNAEPMIMDAEWVYGRDQFMADPRFKAALAKRGLADSEDVFCTPNSAGYFPTENYQNRRILKIPCFSGKDKLHPTLARPIEGLMGVVDTESGEVLDVIDREVVALPAAPVGYAETLPGERPAINPIFNGALGETNIKLAGNLEVSWLDWSFHVRADKRAGLILSLAKFNDRSVAYQINVSEMFVPYMDPNPTWAYRTFMDAGEFGLGYLISSLEGGVDCPDSGVIADLTFPNDIGGTYTRPRALCIFERATGDPAWRHYSGGQKTVDGRPQYELVVRHIPTLGNYDYVVDYVFSPQGNIGIRVGSTGFDAIKSVAAADMESPSAAEDTQFGSLIAPYTVAPFHDHFVNFRIDLDVDGPQNSLVLDTVIPAQIKNQPPRTSSWQLQSQRYKTEGPIVADQHGANGGQRWRVINPNVKTKLKNNPGIWLDGHSGTTAILDDADAPQMRAGFSKTTMWVSRFQPQEQWAAGLYPNLSSKDEGLPAFVSDNESIANEDLVMWYNLAFRHIPRPEDFPILPTYWHELKLRPASFFDMDPSMTLNRNFKEVPEE